MLERVRRRETEPTDQKSPDEGIEARENSLKDGHPFGRIVDLPVSGGFPHEVAGSVARSAGH